MEKKVESYCMAVMAPQTPHAEIVNVVLQAEQVVVC